MESGSIFRHYFVPREVNLSDHVFIKRLEQLEKKLKQDYTISEIKGGWKCTPKRAWGDLTPFEEAGPSFLVTKDTVAFVMKQFGV